MLAIYYNYLKNMAFHVMFFAFHRCLIKIDIVNFYKHLFTNRINTTSITNKKSIKIKNPALKESGILLIKYDVSLFFYQSFNGNRLLRNKLNKVYTSSIVLHINRCLYIWSINHCNSLPCYIIYTNRLKCI